MNNVNYTLQKLVVDRINNLEKRLMILDTTEKGSGGGGTGDIANNSVTNAKLADMPAERIKGRPQGFGTGDPVDMTAEQVAAFLDHGQLGGLGDDDHAIYALLAGRPGGQTIIGQSTGVALEVYRNLTAASTDSPVMTIVQDHPTDDQPTLLVRQDSPLAPAIVVQGANSMMALEFAGSYTIVEGTSTFKTGFYTGVTAGGGDMVLTLIRTNPTGGMMGAGVDGDTTRRIVITADGTFQWGSGAATRDVFLYRGAANVLKTDDTLYVVGQLLVVPGTSVNEAAAGGVLYVDYTASGNTGTAETDLSNYSVPANTLSANGMSLWFEAFGTYAANANNKVVRARLGTTGTNLMVTLETVTNTRTKWRIRGRIIRSATSTEKSVVVWHTSGAAAAATNMDVVTTLNQVNTTATPLRITGQATANNDIVLEGIIIGWDDQNS